MSNNQLKFGKFRQKMCDLLWEYNCYNCSLAEEVIAKMIFNQAHDICNELINEYNITEK